MQFLSRLPLWVKLVVVFAVSVSAFLLGLMVGWEAARDNDIREMFLLAAPMLGPNLR